MLSTYQLQQHIPEKIFRAYDIRGVVGEGFTANNIYTIARALGTEALSREITTLVIARDGRLSGPELSAALAQGLRDAGCDVIDIGAVPTPVLYYATHSLNTGSGVMLTGSHNPANYNGLKMMLGGKAFAAEQIQGLYQRIETQSFSEGQGTLTEKDIAAEYVKRICDDVKLSRSLKIVIDAGNGIAGMIAPQLYKALGCEVVELYCEVDGNFPNHHPDPSQPKNLVDLIAAVEKEQADLGLAFDGDGDRVGVVTNKGETIAADRQLMLYAIDVLSRNPGEEIIFDVKCTRRLAEIIEANGGVPVMWNTGHSLIKMKMAETGAPLAGEMSGHMFFKERWYGFDDGLYTGARLLEILSVNSATCSEVFAELPNDISTPEINVSMADNEKFAFVDQVKQAAFAGGKKITIDGIRVEFNDGWGLLRCSNTTPCLVLRFEADNDAALERIKTIFKEAMQAVKPELDVVL